jgi:hypothetical protein
VIYEILLLYPIGTKYMKGVDSIAKGTHMFRLCVGDFPDVGAFSIGRRRNIFGERRQYRLKLKS